VTRTPHPLLARLTPDAGTTLVEVLVAMVLGIIVTGALFAILEVSLHQESRISDRVSATGRGRITMEEIVSELHSSCVVTGITPIEPESSASKLLVVSQQGAAATFSAVTLHEIVYEHNELLDNAYASTGGVAPNWTFSKTATRKTVLLEGVMQTGTTPIFQYYAYSGSKISETPLAVPLNFKLANEASALAIDFTAESESGQTALNRSAAMSDTVVLRFGPESLEVSSSSTPCA
jgi:hypothetical protein